MSLYERLPILAVASMLATASGDMGMYRATTSPLVTPALNCDVLSTYQCYHFILHILYKISRRCFILIIP